MISYTPGVVVQATPDGYYDLAFYEWYNGSSVDLDWIIIGISQLADGSEYYEVFNWGHGGRDTNTNIDYDNLPPTPSGCPSGTEECDNQSMNPADLYDPDDAGPAPKTGILIDVDRAVSNPPPGTYQYIVIINPPDNGGDYSQIDAVVVTEVPIP